MMKDIYIKSTFVVKVGTILGQVSMTKKREVDQEKKQKIELICGERSKDRRL